MYWNFPLSSFMIGSLIWPLSLSLFVCENPFAGVPVALLTGFLFFWIYRRTKVFFLSYFTTAFFWGLTGGLAVAFFRFGAENPRMGFFKFGFALCVIFVLAKFGMGLAMGYNDRKAIKAVSFCCLPSLVLWALLATGTQIIDAYVDWRFFHDEHLEILITFFGLFSIVFIDGVILDWTLEERHDENAALALGMNTVMHGLLLILFA